MDNDHTITGLANILGVSSSTISRWIKRGDLTTSKEKGHLVIPLSETNSSFITKILIERSRKPQKRYRVPELNEYHFWHESIDDLVWLLKVCYSSQDEVKRKKFRIDSIYQNYIIKNDIKPEKVGKHCVDLSNASVERAMDDLKRGWYNEIFFNYPLRYHSLGLSYKDIYINIEKSSERFNFPSWRIISAYYSIYFYLRAIVYANISQFRFQEHQAALRVFRTSIINKASKAIWFYPFTIIYDKRHHYQEKGFNDKLPEYSKYAYCNHPRHPYPSIKVVQRSLYNAFKSLYKERNSKDGIYTVYDFMLDFRIWANYLDIDTLTRLKGSGFRTFLDHNLALLLFIIGGMAEITILSLINKTNYTKMLNQFFETFIKPEHLLLSYARNMPLFQRYFIAEHLLWLPKGGFIFPDELSENNVVFI